MNWAKTSWTYSMSIKSLIKPHYIFKPCNFKVLK